MQTEKVAPSLAEQFGERWNRFWFTPADPYPLSVLRIGAGLVTLYYLLSWTFDLVAWFGPSGMLSRETVAVLTGAVERTVFHPSFFYWSNEPAILWTFHGLSILVAILFTLGLFSRVTSVLTLLAVLSYIHRGPMLTGAFEPVLTLMLLYLCLAPTGWYLSLDAWRRAGKSQPSRSPGASSGSVAARIALRLIQLHVAGIYAVMALNQLGGEVWWSGEAAWWLAARSQSRLVDLTPLLASSIYLVNLLTHLIVACELGFAILVWHPLLRTFVLAASIGLWIVLVLLTGLVGFAAIMLLANLAFVEPSWRGFRRQV